MVRSTTRTPPPTAASPPDVAAIVENVVGCKWSVRLLGSLARGPQRPSALRRQHPGLSAKVMNERLAKFRRLGLASRAVHGERPPVEVEYALTALGRRFCTLLDAVALLQRDVDGGALPD